MKSYLDYFKKSPYIYHDLLHNQPLPKKDLNQMVELAAAGIIGAFRSKHPDTKADGIYFFLKDSIHYVSLCFHFSFQSINQYSGKTEITLENGMVLRTQEEIKEFLDEIKSQSKVGLDQAKTFAMKWFPLYDLQQIFRQLMTPMGGYLSVPSFIFPEMKSDLEACKNAIINHSTKEYVMSRCSSCGTWFETTQDVSIIHCPNKACRLSYIKKRA